MIASDALGAKAKERINTELAKLRALNAMLFSEIFKGKS